MKIINFGGGLGNQIFEYTFYLYLLKRYPQERIYGNYAPKAFSSHNGLEIDRWFDVQLPKSTFFSKFLFNLFYHLSKMGIKHLYDDAVRAMPDERAIAIEGMRNIKSYFPEYPWMRFKIDEANLSLENKEILKEIKGENSCLLHVRRGDYINEKNIRHFGNICTLDYYKTAIQMIKQKERNVVFFVFSDDIKWVKGNIKEDNIVFVDFNHGMDSPIDMYLMSHCKCAIIANSTFSYWASVIGGIKTVVYPKKWVNIGPPDIFPHTWLGI